ncbi:MAG TPA: phosphotransferase, partial [Acidimicrobiales bacterium]|nr:phosphotransferase [Acidimicrobiales bacterium]
MSGIARVDIAVLTKGLDGWLAQWAPANRTGSRVERIERPVSGWSSDILLTTVRPAVDVKGDGNLIAELVVRVAPAPAVASFPADDFDLHAAVMRTLEMSGLAVPTVLAVENGSGWLGTPFLVMTRVPGRVAGDAPALDPWLAGLPS